MKKNVYLNEYNVLMGMGDATYLPLATGILRAFAESDPDLSAAYAFKPFLFHPSDPEKILAAYDEEPAVAGFSISMWNEQLSLVVAARVKEQWPDCLIVFGGPQCPHAPTDYFALHPFIDASVKAEGEEAFAAILKRNLVSRDFSDIPNVSFRDPDTGLVQTNTVGIEFVRDMDEYPSPYLEGLYDYLFEGDAEVKNLQAIIETNRGCPFLCTFCYWGRGGNTRKYRFHGLDRVKAEIGWVADRGIQYLFNADSNFGMHRRDEDIAQFLVESKVRTGFPDKFRTCWGKNTSERIFKLGALFHEYELEKGITLARQSNNEEVLTNIKRDNIRLDAFTTLQQQFNDLDVPIYAELILGLPGETYESWKSGIQDLLASGLKNQLFVYQAEVYPNTELGDPNYQDQFGIKTKRTILSEIHGKVRDASRVQEFQDIIVETATMPVSDWRRMTVFSVVTMLMHSMKLGFYVLAYLADRYGAKHVDVIEFIIESKSTSSSNLIASEVSGLFDYTDALLAGGGRGIHLPNYGDIYWDAEEGCFLRITEDIAVFYEELELLLIQFLKDRGDKPNLAELHEVLIYQRMRIPGFDVPDLVEKTFESNIPEYFEALFGTSPIDMESTPQRLLCTPTDFKGDHIRFARETILWGRKSGTLLVLVDPETTYLKADTKMVDRHAESIEGLTLFDKRNKFQGFTAKTTN